MPARQPLLFQHLYCAQQAIPLAQQSGAHSAYALAANTVLNAVNATTAAAIFNNVIFTKASQVNKISNN